jgi:signal transduction histidine kinase
VDAAHLRALISAGSALAFELDLEPVLTRLLSRARELTGARYAAVGVLNERRTALDRFVTSGIDPDRHREIGELPQGRGVLGLLITDPRPLRLHDLGEHPQSYGFPAAHPPMRTFLGVPIVVKNEAWGNLYLTDKQSGDFTEDDEETAVVLANWAAIAIANARLHKAETERRVELERTNRALETTIEVASALSGVTEVDRVLELVVQRSRVLLDARVVEVGLLEDGELVIAALAGEGTDRLRGSRVPAHDLLAEAAHRSLARPLIHKGKTLGRLLVLDRAGEDAPFTEREQRLVEAFAASAAMAVATAQTATDKALRLSIAASEAERRRWARELHDDTLQELAGIRVLLSGVRRSNDPGHWRTAIEDAIELLGGGIHNLRALITDLRPPVLDEYGVQAAVEALSLRIAHQHGLDVGLEMKLSGGLDDETGRLSEEIEATIYRLVQEALTNVLKHAGVRHARVSLTNDSDHISVTVQDDGAGFDPSSAEPGFGLLGMRERLALVRAELEVESAPGSGTVVRARIPIARRPAQAVDQATTP